MADKKTNIIREEMLLVAETVAKDKNIERAIVFEAMEEALEKVARSKYGQGRDIRVTINQNSGDISLSSYLQVVEKIDLEEEEKENQIILKEAKKKNPEIKIGEYISESLPLFDFGRVGAQIAKGVIFQKVRDLGKAEAIIKRDEIIPRENFKNGDRVKTYIHDVRQDAKGPQIFLSRTHPQFLAKLFHQEVPEISEGVIEVVNVARDPGSRAKIAVKTNIAKPSPMPKSTIRSLCREQPKYAAIILEGSTNQTNTS